jgi:hypothetical protein
MNSSVFLRTRPALLFSLVCAALLARPPHANGEPTELYATAADGTPLHWVVFHPIRRRPMARRPSLSMAATSKVAHRPVRLTQ